MIQLLILTMIPVMLAWASYGCVLLYREHAAIRKEHGLLPSLKDLVFAHKAPDYSVKLQIRTRVMEWVREHSGTNLARWTQTLNNAVLVGGTVDAVPFLESVWAEERERLARVRHVARMAILFGLFYTSAGLCHTLTKVGPLLQMTNLRPDEWMRMMQPALGGVLAGMSEAFYSSLGGLLIAGGLQVLAQFTLQVAHDRFMREVDAFIQGGLLPVYSSIAEHDRSDIVREVMERADQAFSEVRNQYEKLLAQEASRLLQMEQLQGDVTAAAEGLVRVMASFREGADKLAAFSGTFQQSTQELLTLTGALNQLTQRQEQGAAASERLREAIVPQSAELKAELEARKFLVTDLLGKTSQNMSEQLLKQGDRLILQLAERLDDSLGQALEASLRRQEEVVAELNRVLAAKWEKLVVGTTASQGASRIR